MRIAFLARIHGNVPAFEAVLASLKKKRVDDIVVVGGLVGGAGPDPAGVVALARKRQLTCLRGPDEDALFASAPRGDAAYALHALSKGDLAWLKGLPPSRRWGGAGNVLLARAGAPAPLAGADAVVGSGSGDASVRRVHANTLVDCGAIGFPDPGPESTFIVADTDASPTAFEVVHVPWDADLLAREFVRFKRPPPLPGNTNAHNEAQ